LVAITGISYNPSVVEVRYNLLSALCPGPSNTLAVSKVAVIPEGSGVVLRTKFEAVQPELSLLVTVTV